MSGFTKVENVTKHEHNNPILKWDGDTFFVSLPIDGGVIEKKWKPRITYIVRVRKIVSNEEQENWSFGYETPFTICNFVGPEPTTLLDANAYYEMKFSHKTDGGERTVATIRGRPNEMGEFGNIGPISNENIEEEKNPTVKWNGNMFFVSLSVEGKLLDARWQPSVTSVIRTRKVGEGKWSLGFETPLSHCTTVDLQPDTEYEARLSHKNKAGEGSPAFSRIRTLPKDRSRN